MHTINKYIYELISVAFGFSIIAFFGTLSFFPMEIMTMGEHQSWYSAMLIFSISIIIAFFLLNYFPSQHSSIMIISEIFIQITSLLCMISYFNFNSILTEIWLIQPGWFLRSEGILVGYFLGTIVIKTASGLSFLVKKLTIKRIDIDPENESDENPVKLKQVDSQRQKITVILIILSFIFYITLILVLRYALLFGVFIFLNFIQFGLTIVSFVQQEQKNPIRYWLKTTSETQSNIDTSERNVKLKYITKKATKKYLNDFKGLSIYFLILLVVSLVILPIFPFNIIIQIVIPFGLNSLIGNLSLNIFLSLIIIFLMFIGFTSYIFRTKSHQKFGIYYSSHLKRSSQLLMLAFIDAMKFLGLFAVISQIMYYYDYPVFFPKVISYYLIFGCLGALLYYILGKIKSRMKLKSIVYIISIVVLLLNLILTYYDGISGAQPIVISPEWILTFSFAYLHSMVNFIIVGIPIGFIISDFLFGFLFKDTDSSDSANRALYIIFCIFLCFMLQSPGNYLLNNPGGDPPLSDQTSIVFTSFTVSFILILVVGLGCYIFYEISIPKVFMKRKSIPSITDNFYIKEQTTLRKRNPWKISSKELHQWTRKWKTIALISFLCISSLAIYMSYKSYIDAFGRPMIAYSPSNYNIWVLNSSERIAKSTPLNADPSRVISSINISTAMNEYNAIQLIWKPDGRSITDLSYEISNFENTVDSTLINKGNCSLRYVEWVIEEEFPDILRNFTTFDLLSYVNNILWFSIKTPKNIDAGWYSGNITFRFNNYETEIVHINLNVWNFSIPDVKHIRTTIGAYSLNDQQIDNYIEHRVNDYGIPIRRADNLTALENIPGFTCYLNATEHFWVFNWTWWEAETQKKLDQGMNNFVLEYPNGITDRYRYPYIDNASKMSELHDWLTKVQNHMEFKNWLNYSSMFFVDEFALFIPDGYTRINYFADLLILAQKIKESAPKLRLISTASPNDEISAFESYFDIYCPVTRDRDGAMWDSLMSQGKEFWMYASVGPLSPYPCSHLYNRLYEIRILFWQAWRYQIHGFLYWQAQAYFHGKNSIGYNGYGDGWFIYEQNNVLFDSPRWENYLEAQEDYEYLWLLNASLNYLEVHPSSLSESEIDSIRGTLTRIVNSLVGEKTNYTNNPQDVYEARQKIGNELNFISNYLNISSIAETQWNSY
jgi:hypothetical protein